MRCLNCVCWLAVFVLGVNAVASAADRPNLLFCLADDWGYPDAGAYGGQVARTPAFDRLAREGVLFEHAYISSPSCTPSRNAILTGQQFYRLRQGASLHGWLDVGEPNFMVLLKDGGYDIGHFSKAWGPGNWRLGGYDEHPCGPQSSFADFMSGRDAGKPFAFWLGTKDPHRGYDPELKREMGLHPDNVKVPPFYPDAMEIREDMADYYAEVQRWDGDVGAALKLLEESGELENTIVVMTGDHGMPFPRGKGNVYDFGSRVPLAIRWGHDMVAPGRRIEGFVSLTDLAPTFLEAAGVDVPEVMTGTSLLPILKGGDGPDRTFEVFGRERHTAAQEMPSFDAYPMRAIRTDGWLLILNLEPDRWPAGVPENATHPMDSFSDSDAGPTKTYLMAHRDEPDVRRFFDLSFAKRPPVELYDCDDDPDQLVNLADDPAHAARASALREQLVTYLRETGDPRFTGEEVRFDDFAYTDRKVVRRVGDWLETHDVEPPIAYVEGKAANERVASDDDDE